MPELLIEFWEVILLIGGALIYAIRQEGKLNTLFMEMDAVKRQRDEDRAMYQKQREEDRAAAQKSRDEVHSTLKDVNDKLDRLVERLLGK